MKFSQIPVNPSPAGTDFVVGVTAGNVDFKAPVSSIGGGGGITGLTVGTTTVAGGTSGFALTDASGVLGNVLIRTILTADTNYYVSATGSDSNNGLTVGTAWATLQHAMSFIASSVDGAGFNVFVNIGAGSFKGFGVVPTTGVNILLFNGAGSASTTLTGGPNDGVLNFGEILTFNFQCNSIISVDLVKWKPDASNLLLGQYTIGTFFFLGNYINFDTLDTQIDLSNGPGGVLFVENGGFCQTISTVGVVSGGGSIATFLDVANQGVVTDGAQYRFSGSADTYSTAFALVRQSGILLAGGFAATGSVNGKRFQVEDTSCIVGGTQYGALGPNYYPGSSAGTVDASSFYDGFPGPLPGINTQTASYALAITDSFEIVEMNVAGANTLTVPLNATVAFEIGTKIWITQTGAGSTTVTGAGGVTVHNAGALSGQWATVKLYKRGTDEWVQTNA